MGSPLRRIVQWFKTMTTNEYIRGVKSYNWRPFHNKLWQRNYYEHIIRNDEDYQRIADYIQSNPLNWEDDELWTN
jgi:REP element-mobilizing transposase RayT